MQTDKTPYPIIIYISSNMIKSDNEQIWGLKAHESLVWKSIEFL